MRYYDYSPMYQQHSFFWAGGLLSVILNVALWVAIIWLIVKLFKHFAGASSHSCCGNSGACCMTDDNDQEKANTYLDIAKMRYAKGEIDKKHYDELKKEFSPTQSHEMKVEVEEEGSAKE